MGRLIIPKELRREFDISPGTPLEFLVGEGGFLALRRWTPRCVFCGGGEDVVLFRGKYVCRGCAEEAVRAGLEVVAEVKVEGV